MKDPLDRLVLPEDVRAARRLQKSAEKVLQHAVETGEDWLDVDLTRVYGDRGDWHQTPADVLAQGARMQRDGWSLARIRTELQISKAIPDRILERALAEGHRILEKRIAEGLEPAESKMRVDLE